MDGLSGPASVIAIVSLTIQLADSINKLCGLFSSIRNAPEDIKSILKDLQVLETVRKSIQHNQELYGPHQEVAAALQGCHQELLALQAIVDDLAPGFAMRNSFQRKWNAIRSVSKSEKMKDFRARLQEAKTTLILALQSSLR
ncbi:hypothetical protein W97_06600 [Coniosporium apollinis CBS 100218]|uniref:NACHT-NTPase and P-loop NTPases N-terminal domain-containing protein n=1 Tax=Coniosporium apollinis (strain CBS 100218) TaxID=1168221 RepID=R7YZL2_CONA1|nr:uncharacterized protein W97_06600 [Coniosporium apollinis CBS 100218]EON67347.1 hypothetical protein W97_06600 [Coniosporium apollinis CBS 100218]